MAEKKLFTPMSGLQRLFEAGLIIIILLAIFMMLSLVSYHPSDPGWSQTAWGGEISNAAGPAGAWLADILLFVFGFSAYLVPPFMVFFGWVTLWRPRALTEICYLTLSLRIIGFLMLLLSLLGLASMNVGNIYYFSAGGLVGDMLAAALNGLFGSLGTTLMLLCGFATGVTFFTGWSWLLIVERLGGAVLEFPNWLSSAPSRLLDWQLERRQRRPGAREQAEAEPLAVAATPAPATTTAESGFVGWRRFKDRLGSPRETDEEWEEAAEDPLLAPVPAAEKRPAPLKKAPPVRREPVLGGVDEQDPDPIATIAETNGWNLDDDEELELPWLSDDPEPVAAAAPAPSPKPAPPARPRRSDLTPLPSVELLDKPKPRQHAVSESELERIARLVEAKLADYNVQANVVGVYPGPVITRFELDLAPGVKVSKITNLARDLARSLSAISVRVVEVIPGKPYVGLELPNTRRETVYLREVLDSEPFRRSEHPLTLVLGQDIAGEPVVVNLARMPHVLVAGTTGSGKSVGVNVMILSMLYKATPEDVRFIMIDPKMLELSVYEGIPHLLTEVVTDMKEAANALRWCVGEMERRYKLMSAMGVRNLKGFNTKVQEAIDAGEPLRDPLWQPTQSMDTYPPALEKLPHIVVVIDEFADMMMIVGKKVEELIARIAQKARAAGIHLILATQRPSVDVITGLIKANIPTRMSFQVSSKIDSRTILDQQGAESLLGMGDMLYLPAGDSNPTRVHGAFVDDHEVHRVVAAWKERGEPNYIEEILNGDVGADGLLPGEVPEGGDDGELDELFDQAVAFVVESRRGSTSSVQRKFKIGYNRAARIIEQMEQQGIVSPAGGNGQREVLAPAPARE
ncbi:cell division protein FtsK [Zobellella denitrificans]|uniref:DNA translocase FtsK n=1 Tax=Zobellella denitrificans TaxID=347534 RepID=A0A231MVW5_9GAMM|nr:DNA translocase FtsK 4TM domain-containing protein [Zobellella denitrificans]ATG73264.1 cell division protein FtsK [Zobellella denitrificans]OXS14169.1 cell division protein FtsK [Zobellella denitrificans]